jgi:monoamine oxidase
VSGVRVAQPGSHLLQVESSGGTFLCRHCVVTVPLGVLQSGRLAFEPQLPSSFTQSLKESAMGLLNKSILLFDEVFWDADASVLYCLVPPGRPLGWFFNDFKYSGRKALVYLTGSDDARRSEARSDEELTQDVMRFLTTMYGERCRPPTKVHHTRWWADPMSLGSYSYRRVGFDPSHGFDGFLKPHYDGRLFFAGEHTSRDLSSTVHGAVESGRRAAEQVLRACSDTLRA